MCNQSGQCSSRSRNKQGKGKRLWKKVKYQLVEYHSLPGYLRDNEYIQGHYRANWPLKQAFFSIFSIHNETLNVWTYGSLNPIPIYFLCVFFKFYHLFSIELYCDLDLHSLFSSPVIRFRVR